MLSTFPVVSFSKSKALTDEVTIGLKLSSGLASTIKVFSVPESRMLTLSKFKPRLRYTPSKNGSNKFVFIHKPLIIAVPFLESLRTMYSRIPANSSPSAIR